MEFSSATTLARGTLVSANPARTRAIGRALGRRAEAGSVLALSGELGAGKTQLAKGVAEGLRVIGVVNSPTFVLMNEHPGRLRLYHIDAYRLGDPEEAWAAGLLDERQADGVTVIEWADRLAGWLPPGRIEIHLVAGEGPSDRTLRWQVHGASHEPLAEVLMRS